MFCSCGWRIQKGYNYCPSCGRAIDAAQPNKRKRAADPDAPFASTRESANGAAPTRAQVSLGFQVVTLAVFAGPWFMDQALIKGLDFVPHIAEILEHLRASVLLFLVHPALWGVVLGVYFSSDGPRSQRFPEAVAVALYTSAAGMYLFPDFFDRAAIWLLIL